MSKDMSDDGWRGKCIEGRVVFVWPDMRYSERDRLCVLYETEHGKSNVFTINEDQTL